MLNTILCFCLPIEFFTFFKDILLTIFGGFIAVIITDYIKRPNLEINFNTSPNHQGGKKMHSYLVVTIHNKPFNFMGIKIDREAALDCRVSILKNITNPTFSTDGRRLPDEIGTVTSNNLLWESELSSALEITKTIYCGLPEKVRIIGKIDGESGYFTYNQADVLMIKDGGKYFEERMSFKSTVNSIKGNKATKEFIILNKGTLINDISVL